MRDFFTALKYVLFDYKSLILSIFGVFLYTVGMNLFLTPINLIPVGILGVAFEISYFFEKISGIVLSANIIYFVLNIPILLLGYFQIGKKFTIRTLIVVGMTTILMSAIPVVQIIDDTLLSVIASSVISGIGVALLLNTGASTGGTDIISLFMAIKKNRPFGTFNLIFNGIVIIIAVFQTGDINTAVYLLILVYVTGVTIDKIHKLTDSYTLIIVTTKADEIKKEIFGNGLKRGMTVIDSKGGFTGNQNNTILITCEKKEYPQFVKIIKTIDEKAFISTFKTQEVVGAFENTYLSNL